MSGSNGEHTYTLSRRFTANIAPGLAVRRVANVNAEPAASLATDPTIAGGQDIEGLVGDAGGTSSKPGPVVTWGPAIMQLAEGVVVGTDSLLTCGGDGKGVLPEDGDQIVAVYQGAKDAGANATEARVFVLAAARIRYFTGATLEAYADAAAAAAQAAAEATAAAALAAILLRIKVALAAEVADKITATITVVDANGDAVPAEHPLQLTVLDNELVADGSAFTVKATSGSQLTVNEQASIAVLTANTGIVTAELHDVDGGSDTYVKLKVEYLHNLQDADPADSVVVCVPALRHVVFDAADATP